MHVCFKTNHPRVTKTFKIFCRTSQLNRFLKVEACMSVGHKMEQFLKTERLNLEAKALPRRMMPLRKMKMYSFPRGNQIYCLFNGSL